MGGGAGGVFVGVELSTGGGGGGRGGFDAVPSGDDVMPTIGRSVIERVLVSCSASVTRCSLVANPEAENHDPVGARVEGDRLAEQGGADTLAVDLHLRIGHVGRLELHDEPRHARFDLP